MRTTQSISMIISAALVCLLVSCGGKETSADSKDAQPVKKEEVKIEIKEEVNIPAIPENYKVINFKKLGMPAKIMAPKTADFQSSTRDDNQGKRNDFIVWAFHIPGGNDGKDSTSAELSMYTTAWELARHKSYLESSVNYRVLRMVKVEADLLVYTTKPGNSLRQACRQKEKEVYAFLMLIKDEKNNKTYAVEAGHGFDYSKDEVLRLIAIGKSLKFE